MDRIDGSITFFYYDDLEAASRFYGEVMGFSKVLDVGFARVFRVYGDTHVGLVDGATGSMKPAAEKSVMLSLFVDDVDQWYRKLTEKGLELNPPVEPEYLKMRVLIFHDPEGYTLELLEWIENPLK